MAWLLDMSRKEKEEYVIRLYKENKSIREIAKIMHMSFRDIGAIINKWKEETEREKGKLEGVYDYNVKSNSKITQAIQLFSEGKAPVDVVIALDIPADEVRAIYREFWELKRMYRLVQIYEEAKYDLRTFLRLHKIVNEQGMGEHEIINVLKLANNNELPYLQEKVEYFRNQINNLELEKTKCTNHVLTLNRRIDDLTETVNMYESSLNEKREEIACINQELKRLDKLASKTDTVNKNSEEIEIFYASGSWHNLTP